MDGLQVLDAYGGDFWLHLEMKGNATLEDLDDYLRAILVWNAASKRH